jgi:hypothetical protein
MVRIRKYQSYTTGDFYKNYLSNIELGSDYEVSIATYRAIVADYMKHIMSRIMDNSEEFKLPCRLGRIYVVKKKPLKYTPTHCGVDFHATASVGKWVIFLNEHSNGYHYRFKWEKLKAYVRNIGMYEMIMSRANKRTLAKKIKSGEVDYIDIR